MNERTEQGDGEMSMLIHDPSASPLSGWHLDKRISVAHILATLSMTTALVAWIWALSERVVVNERTINSNREITMVEHGSMQLQITAVEKRDATMMAEWIRQNSEILRRLERIEDGVNRHIQDTKRD